MQRVVYWSAYSASASQLATLVASQTALLNTKPASATPMSYTGSGGTVCPQYPVSGTGGCYTMPANVPIVSNQGVRVMSAAALSNGLTYSALDNCTHWACDGTTAIAAASASCPIDQFGVRMSLVTPDVAGDGARQNATGKTARGIWLAYPTAGSACNVTLADYAGANPAVKALTATPTWYGAATTGDHGISVVESASGGCATFCASGALSNATLVAPIAEQFNSCSGSAFSASADSPNRPSTIKNYSRWAAGVKATAPSWSPAADGYLFALGTDAAANSMLVKFNSALAYFYVYGASGYREYSWTHGLTAGTQHRIVCGAEPPACLVDGAPVTLSLVAGAGNTWGAIPATLYIGEKSDGTTQLGIQNMKAVDGPTRLAVDRELQRIP